MSAGAAGRPPDPGGIEPVVLALREAIRRRGFSPHTLRAYEAWVRRFALFHRERSPAELGIADARHFLDHVTRRGRASAATRNQAANALAFLMRDVLRRDIAREALPIERARPSRRVPLVLSRPEIETVLRHVDPSCRLLVALLYGSGLRLSEGCRLRVRDVDFERDQIVVRDGKGQKDRVTLLPASLKTRLRDHLDRVACQHQADLVRGAGSVPLPAGARAAEGGTSDAWPWQWAFPARSTRLERATGALRRGHLHERLVQREFAVAVRASGLTKPATCHSLRHAFATHLHEAGCDIRTIQSLLGHRDVATTLIYTRSTSWPRGGVRSPLDRSNDADPHGRDPLSTRDPRR